MSEPSIKRSWTPPAWDPQAVSAEYLAALRQQAQAGPFDPVWLEDLLHRLGAALNSAYSPEAVERAACELEPLIAAWERIAAQQDQPPGPPSPDLLPEAMQEPIARARRTAECALSAAARLYAAGQSYVEELRETRRRAEERIAQARARAEQQQRERREAADEARRRALAASASQTALPIDVAALHRPLVGTWLALVLLSWVGLLWGAILSAPFTGAMVFVASIAGGFIVVPVFGTVFGFAGMDWARTATLARMGFRPCGADHPLDTAAARFAAALIIPKPQVGTIPMHNAFAMGLSRKDATIAIGQPLMQQLTEAETEAVLGHELGHVVSGDMRRMMLMRTFQNALVWFMLAQGLKQLVRWVVGWAAELYILASSREREYWADAIGAALTSKEAMIGALEKLQAAPALTAAENTHARFMVRGRVRGLFSTHPTFEQRIAALVNETYLRRVARKAA